MTAKQSKIPIHILFANTRGALDISGPTAKKCRDKRPWQIWIRINIIVFLLIAFSIYAHFIHLGLFLYIIYLLYITLKYFNTNAYFIHFVQGIFIQSHYNQLIWRAKAGQNKTQTKLDVCWSSSIFFTKCE